MQCWHMLSRRRLSLSHTISFPSGYACVQYVCLDYPRAVDIIRLRIHSIRAALKASAEEEHLVQEFFCLTPACNGRRYTSLDAADIIHPETNAFHCEACGAELALDTGDDGDEEGMNSFERARQRREEARQLIGQFDEEIKPLEEAIAKALASGVDPPDHGALRDWLQVRNNAAREQQRIANAALARGDAAGAAAATAARPARQGGMFDFLEDIEFEVQLEGDEGAGGAPVDGAAASGAGPQGGAGPSSGGGAAGGRPSLLASRQRKVIPPWHAKRQQQQQAAIGEPAPAAAPVAATAPGQGAAAAATASQTVADEEFAAEFIRQMYAFQQTQHQVPDATAAAPAAAAPAPAPVAPAPQTQETQDDSDDEEWEDV
jgi:transcription initiation factor IIE alpha subunit